VNAGPTNRLDRQTLCAEANVALLEPNRLTLPVEPQPAPALHDRREHDLTWRRKVKRPCPTCGDATRQDGLRFGHAEDVRERILGHGTR